MGVFHTNVFLVRALSENSWLRQSLEGSICFCFLVSHVRWKSSLVVTRNIKYMFWRKANEMTFWKNVNTNKTKHNFKLKLLWSVSQNVRT